MDHQSVAHAWAHDNYNRNGEINGSRVFATEHNRAIYSYGAHFCMARITDSVKFRCLINSGTYSSSTSTHMRYVSSAASHMAQFECSTPDAEFHTIYDREMVKLISDIRDIDAAKSSQAEMQARVDKRASKRLASSDLLDGWLDDRKNTVSYLTSKLIDRAKDLELFRKEFKITLKGRSRKVLLIRKKFASGDWSNVGVAEAKRAAREKIRLEKLRLEQAKESEQREAENLVKWLAGEDVRMYHQRGAAKLRVFNHPVSGYRVETNQGAHVPVRDAWALWRIATRCKQKGESLCPDRDAPINLGCYRLDSVSSNGNVVIGCHRIPYSEMERIAGEVEKSIA